jgi:hypothetical protein
VNCVEYIENFLSAHADGELSADDLLDAEQHLRQCLGCRAKLDDERALKRLLHEHIEMRAMPDAMRRQLLEALDRAAEEEAGQQSTARPGHAGHRLPGRPMLWAALALAAALATVFVSTRRFLPYRPPLQASTPARDADFDVAIAAFDRFQREFEPNVPSDSPAVLSAAYAGSNSPADGWTSFPTDARSPIRSIAARATRSCARVSKKATRLRLRAGSKRLTATSSIAIAVTACATRRCRTGASSVSWPPVFRSSG